MSLRERLNSSSGKEESHGAPAVLLPQVQGQIHQQVITLLTEETGQPVSESTEGIRERIEGLAHDLLDRYYPNLSPREQAQIIEGICDETFGFGPITPLLKDPSVSEIMVNGPKDVYVERSGQISRTDCQFRDRQHVMTVIERILAPLGRRVDESSPMVDARLPDGSRVNVVIPPISLTGPALTVRKFRHEGFSMDDLVEVGSLTPEMADFLQCCVRSRLSILVSGGTASGKTTMLNALSNFIPADERIITMEDAAELRLRQGHVISLEARPANAEGKGEVTIRAMLRNALRMRPDRIVIGEVRGGEALDLLQAMNTGHNGSLSTLHANKPRDALGRLETMALMANVDLPVRVVREQIAAAVDIVVHLDRSEDGQRRVVNITEVHGMEGDVVTLHDVFEFDRIGVAPDGRVLGQFRRCQVRPHALDAFRRYGVAHQGWTQGG